MCLTWPDCPKVPPLTDADIDANKPEDYCLDCHNKDAEIARLRYAFGKESHEVEQILGQALGYPWYKDDPKNFPGTTEKDGVCVGEHIPQTLAMDAVAVIRAMAEALQKVDISMNAEFAKTPDEIIRDFTREQEAHDVSPQ